MASTASGSRRGILLKKAALSLARLRQTLEAIGTAPNPIIVLGMHRSGTSMLVDLLQRGEIYMGSRLSGNREPRVIQDANRQIFCYFGASWMDPHLLPTPDILHAGFDGLMAGIADRLSDDLEYAFFDELQTPCLMWGFKDPRISITAGLLLRIFPDIVAPIGIIPISS